MRSASAFFKEPGRLPPLGGPGGGIAQEPLPAGCGFRNVAESQGLGDRGFREDPPSQGVGWHDSLPTKRLQGATGGGKGRKRASA